MACSYEAFVIYTFLALCLSYVGGPGAVEIKMNGFLIMPNIWHCTCCMGPQLVDGLFVRRCKQVRELHDVTESVTEASTELFRAPTVGRRALAL